MKIHFIGIGGIGVSALARYYLEKGNQISGSDLVSSEVTKSLENLGTEIFIGPHKAKHLAPDVKQVIYSPAIFEENPELKKAKKMGINCLSYPEALGKLTKKYFTIAVCGAHGKGTTTAMISLILIKAGLDPTVIVGTRLREFGESNCRVGESKYLVIEADEYKEAFLNYHPKIIVLTNIDREHLDYYRDLDHIIESFGKFIKHLPKDGILIANKDNESVNKLLNYFAKLNCKTYSLKQKEAKRIKKVLKIPGEHNLSDALAALALARILKIPDKISLEALSEYKGAWRRFEIKRIRLPITYKLKPKTCTLISDYAHHPTEIEATLKATKEKFPKKEIWCVFQPHQYQRTFRLFDDFVRVLTKAPIEKLILAPIYSVAGREDEKIKRQVSSKKLTRAVNQKSNKNAICLPPEKIVNFLKENLKSEQVLIIMGAGDIYKLIEQL